MSSFFGRFKSNAGPASPTAGNAPPRKDANAPQPTPLERLLADAGPLRSDGSDKFFGFENFGSTCYCNSIIQCLYYSVPFRDQVINFPTRSPQDALRKANAPPRLVTDLGPEAGSNGAALSPTKQKQLLAGASQPSPRKLAAPPGPAGPAGQKPEDNKDSPEYKKKQAMAVGPVINMDYENSASYGMSESLFTSLKDIFEAIIAHRSRIGVVSANKFLEILRRENEMFRSAMHQDAHEFLNLLLNQVVENVEQFSKQLDPAAEAAAEAPEDAVPTAVGNTGWVHDLFEGTLTSETRCLTCENTSQRDEAFLDLSVDLEQHTSVTSCLRKFSEEEMLCERNKFHCDICGGLQEAEKRMKIKRLPRILALHLKRFKYTEDLQRLQKLFHRVVYPYHLRLFNTTDDAEDPDRLYELYAIVVHIGGGPYHGHYVSIIKTQDRGWLLFDDEMVEPVDKNYVRNFFGGESNLACAYILFYQETTIEAMQKELDAEGLEAEASAAEPTGDGAAASAPPPMANGHAIPQTPGVDEPDQFVSLDHAATMPVLSPSPTQPGHALEATLTSPSVPTLDSTTELLSRAKSKKERAQAEKERKAAEKELTRQAKQKRKEAEQKRMESHRKQEEELKAAIAASKASKAEEDKRRKETAGSSGDEAKEVKEKKEGKENGHGFSSGLHRFRHPSMSLRHKPKFWVHKDKHDGEKESSTPAPEGGAAPAPATEEALPAPMPEKAEKAEKPEKSKHLFGLGRKKSAMALFGGLGSSA